METAGGCDCGEEMKRSNISDTMKVINSYAKKNGGKKNG